jgi:hypothetical protein
MTLALLVLALALTLIFDLSALTDELVSVVDHSVRPTRARVWLRQTDLAHD